MSARITPLRALEMPRLIEVRPNLVLACFQLMKLLPARFMLDAAEERGQLRPGITICETTSGTFGLALAMLSAVREHPLVLISDPAVDPYLATRLKQLGARVEIISEPGSTGNFQAARLARLRLVLDGIPGAFWPNQYSNPDNPKAYGILAERLADEVGHIDWLVGSVGSGGSVCGTAIGLRELGQDPRVAGVDTPGSVLFGQADGPRKLRGLGNSILPTNLDHTVFDQVHWVTAAEAFKVTRRLYRKTGLFLGGTSGATFLVADWVARSHPGLKVAALMPDEGHRYTETIYNDTWVAEIDSWSRELPDSPAELVSMPLRVDRWSALDWHKRTLAEWKARETAQ